MIKFTSAVMTVVAFWSLIAHASGNRVKVSTAVSMYLFPFLVTGSGPTISIDHDAAFSDSAFASCKGGLRVGAGLRSSHCRQVPTCCSTSSRSLGQKNLSFTAATILAVPQ